MEPQFWHARWKAGQIGFHQAEINRHLSTYWPRLQVPETGAVLVPLCGKSRDMTWLHAQGHRVVGVELSRDACEAFFVEQDLTFSVEDRKNAQVFHGQGRAEGIDLWCANVFDVTPAEIGPVAALFDRAAMIALPAPMRQKYAQHLTILLPAGARGLLVTIDHPPGQREGPPFAVPQAEVRALLEPAFSIEPWLRDDLLARPEAAERNWGVTEMHEDVYGLTRR
jgi:thiopurine S-methyltransferase